MSDGVIVVVDLGHEDSELIRREVESFGVKAVVCEHDVDKEYLDKLGTIIGFILNGGPHKKIRGFRVEASEDILDSELPMYGVDHASWAGVDLFTWPKDKAERLEKIEYFLTEKCKLKV